VTHLVWDWNGTLLDDLALVVAATNACLATVGGPAVTAEEHRLDFRRPISAYYAHVLGRPIDEAEFARLDGAFHDAYRDGLDGCALTHDALAAMSEWTGTQSLLSMFHHRDLVPAVTRQGLFDRLLRVDGLRDPIGGGSKAPHLRAHLKALNLEPTEVVLIGDSVDDAESAVEVGARVVLYDGGFTHGDLLRTTGQPTVSSLLEAVRLAARKEAVSSDLW
jgi:phosphoglycolate phosphatase-like HAD superfamily hydrolase